MSLLYFEGFDMHQLLVSGLDPGAGSAQDAGRYWRGGTSTHYSFESGYTVGNSMNVTNSGVYVANGPSAGGFTARAGFWFKRALDVGVTLVSFGSVDNSFDARVRVDPANILYLQTTGSSNALYQPIDDDWHYLEFYADTANGNYTVKFDTTVVINETGRTPNTAGHVSVSLNIGSLDSSPHYLVDHFWMTTGEFPAGTDVLGVQVIAAEDTFDGNDGLRGTIVINDTRFQTSGAAAEVSSQAGYASNGNWTNVINYLFANNPATSSPWTQAAFDSISEWGACYYQVGPIADKMRVAGMALAYLDYNGGRPLVRNLRASGLTSFSGPWTKSDDTKTYSSLVTTMPRTFGLLWDDVPSIFCDGDGCILFRGPADQPLTPPTFFGVGLTFAEEYREDYLDFAKVDGGEPFESFFIAGYSVLGEGNRNFESNYVTVNYENVSTGAAYIQGLWDYSENSSTGRWSMRQSIVNIGGDYKHGAKRFKIRGRGKALQIKVTNRGNTPFVINGWTTMVTSNTSV